MSVTLRFDDITQRKKANIMVVGVGATGSWFAELAVRQGYKIYAIDYDDVELHNVGTSAYLTDDIGKLKAEALANRLGNVVPIVSKFSEKLVADYEPDILVSAVDNMATRKEIFAAAKKYRKPLIDIRVHYPYALIYAVEPSPIALGKYAETLYDDGEAWRGDCTRQNTPYLSAVAASIALKYASFPIRGIKVATFNADKVIAVEVAAR